VNGQLGAPSTPAPLCFTSAAVATTKVDGNKKGSAGRFGARMSEMVYSARNGKEPKRDKLKMRTKADDGAGRN
jgi:hypothetical protein